LFRPNDDSLDARHRLSNEPISRERQEAGVGAAPAGMLERGALAAEAVQRAHCRNLSLDVSAPQRITGTAQASGE
jgi:hypothetical protein